MSVTNATGADPRTFADSVLKRMSDDGTLAPEADGASKAAMTPTFSKGTAALDDTTGQPVVPREQGKVPAFVERHIDVAETPPAAEPPAAAAVVETPAVAAAPAQTAPAAAAGAAAVEAVAQQIAEEFEEFEFTDPDIDVPIKIRAPKAQAEIVKRGYGRRAAYDRSVSYLQNARAALEPLIADGRINRILPMLQAAIENEAYGGYVTQGFERMRQGLPLIEQARAEAAAAGAAVAAPPEPAFTPEGYADPFTEVVTAATRPLQAELAELRQWRQEEQQRREQTATQQQQQHQRSVAENMQMANSHQDLARMFPGKFDPNKGANDPAWQQAVKYAREAGYTDEGAYGIRAGIVFGGQQIVALDNERLAATASPAAAAFAQTDARLLDTARREAAASAQTVSGGGAASSALPAPPPKPTTTYVDASGKTVMKPHEQFKGEMLAWHTQYGRLQQ